jgi:hypothetical protein
MGWFRMWDDIIDSRKLHGIAPETCWAWVQLMAAANRHDHENGTLPKTEELAWALRLSKETVETMLDATIAAGLVEFDGGWYRIHDWRHWQPKDPSAAARMARLRNGKRNADRNGKRNANRNASATGTVTEAQPQAQQLRSQELRRKKEEGKTEEERSAPRAARTHSNCIDEGTPEWQSVLAKAQELWGTRRFPELLRESYGSSPNANGALMHWWDMGTPEAFRQALVDLRAKPDNEHTLDRYCAFVRREINRPTANGTAAKPEKWDPEEQRAYYAARYEAQEAEAARKAGA